MSKAESKDESKARKRAKKEAKKAKKAKKEAKRHKKEKKLKKEKKQNEKKSKHDKNEENGSHSDDNNEQRVSPHGIKATLEKLPQDHNLDKDVFRKQKMEISVSVLPVALGNIMHSLEESVRQMILKYKTNVGMLLAFENLRRLENDGHGRILGELPHLHYQVGFDALVFIPRVGCKMQGKIIESFPSHLGLLVLDYVNAMIPAEKLHKVGYSYDYDLGGWVLEDGCKIFSKNAAVNFVVEKIHECAGSISLEGAQPSSTA